MSVIRPPLKRKLQPFTNNIDSTRSVAFTDLPHAGVFAIHDCHIVNLVLLNIQSLGLINLLYHEAHKRVVWSVGCQGQTKQLA